MQNFQRYSATCSPRFSLVSAALFWLACSVAGADGVDVGQLGVQATHDAVSYRDALVPLLVAGAILSLLALIAWTILQILNRSTSD